MSRTTALAAVAAVFLMTAAVGQAREAAERAELSPSHIAAAGELYRHFGRAIVKARLFNELAPRVLHRVRRDNPDLPQSAYARFAELYLLKLDEGVDRLSRPMASVVARHVSEQDLVVGVTFYKSSAGKRLVAVLPEIAATVSAADADRRATTGTQFLTGRLSEADVAAMVAFGETPAARRISAAAARITAETSYMVDRLGTTIAGQVVEQMLAEGYDL